jgi:hypothetical protein
MPYVVFETYNGNYADWTAYVTDNPPPPEDSATFKRWIVFFERAIDAYVCAALRTKPHDSDTFFNYTLDDMPYVGQSSQFRYDDPPFDLEAQESWYGNLSPAETQEPWHDDQSSAEAQEDSEQSANLMPWLKWMRDAGLAGE